MKKFTIPAAKDINLVIDVVSENVQDEIPQVTITQKQIEDESKYDQCIYCDGLVKRASQNAGDHFPIPKRNGGTLIVPCCLSCHRMKDNYNFEHWPAEWVSKVLEDFPKLSRETRIFLAKAITVMSDCVVRQKGELINEETTN